MAKYEFWGIGTRNGERTQIIFAFNGDKLDSVSVDGREVPVELAIALYQLDEDHAPGYVPHPKTPSVRWNAVSFLDWDAFDDDPALGGDAGDFDFPDDEYREDVVY